jgi:hypothetical protein
MFDHSIMTWLLLTLAILSLSTSGCTTRRKRLMEERSGLLAERDQMQHPWQPQALRPNKKLPQPDESATPAERLQKIDQRVAELDEEILQIK